MLPEKQLQGGPFSKGTKTATPPKKNSAPANGAVKGVCFDPPLANRLFFICSLIWQKTTVRSLVPFQVYLFPINSLHYWVCIKKFKKQVSSWTV